MKAAKKKTTSQPKRKKVRGGGGTVNSVDGKRTISVKEFDRLAEEGSAELDQFVDWSKAERINAVQRVNVDFPKATVLQLDLEANRLGITRQSLIKMWIGERLDHCGQEALLSSLIAIVGETSPKAKKKLEQLNLKSANVLQ